MQYKMCRKYAKLTEDVCDEFVKYKADRPTSKTHKAIVSVFEFDERILTDGTLRVKTFDNYSKEWVDFIHTYRHSNDTDYDLIIGPIANDDVRTQYARLSTTDNIDIAKLYSEFEQEFVRGS